MAIVFYFKDKGEPGKRPIYGVHPNLNIRVPDNIAHIEVAEDTNSINWPSNSDEHSCCVNDISKQIELDLEKYTARIKRKKQIAYGDISNLIEMIWRDIDNGALDKTGEFYLFIKNINDSFLPK